MLLLNFRHVMQIYFHIAKNAARRVYKILTVYEGGDVAESTHRKLFSRDRHAIFYLVTRERYREFCYPLE